jgi:hypothetical protein
MTASAIGILLFRTSFAPAEVELTIGTGAATTTLSLLRDHLCPHRDEHAHRLLQRHRRDHARHGHQAAAPLALGDYHQPFYSHHAQTPTAGTQPRLPINGSVLHFRWAVPGHGTSFGSAPQARIYFKPLRFLLLPHPKGLGEHTHHYPLTEWTELQVQDRVLQREGVASHGRYYDVVMTAAGVGEPGERIAQEGLVR